MTTSFQVDLKNLRQYTDFVFLNKKKKIQVNGSEHAAQCTTQKFKSACVALSRSFAHI